MTNKDDKEGRSKNVTSKDLLHAALVVTILLILVWYKETGSKVAAFIFAIIPIIGLINYLRIPAEKRKKNEQEAKAELKQSMIGKFWIGFTWLFAVLSIVLILHSLLK